MYKLLLLAMLLCPFILTLKASCNCILRYTSTVCDNVEPLSLVSLYRRNLNPGLFILNV